MQRSVFEELDTRMTLDLVHSRNYYVGELEQVPEVSRRDVGDTCPSRRVLAIEQSQ